MKKYIFLVSILACSIVMQGQNKEGMSIEAGAAYYYHFMGGKTNNDFNYGFSLLVSKRFRKVKVSAGIDYATKFYYYEVTPTSTNFLTRRDYKMQYLDFPFLVNVTVTNSKSAGIGLLTGFVLNKVIRYDMVSQYANRPPVNEKDLTIPSGLGLSFRMGVTFSKSFGNRFVLNVAPFSGIKLIMNGGENNGDPHAGSYRSLPDNRFSLGFNAGVEYLFK